MFRHYRRVGSTMVFNIDGITEENDGARLHVVISGGHEFGFTLKASTVGKPGLSEHRGAHLVLDPRTYTDEMQDWVNQGSKKRVRFEIPGAIRHLGEGEYLVFHTMFSTREPFTYLIEHIFLFAMERSP